MNWDDEIKKLFDDPVFDDVKARPKRLTSSDRLVVSFEEINDFVESYNRIPENNGDAKEKRLSRRLESILVDISKRERCMHFDRFGILKSQEDNLNAELKSIFNDPIFESTAETEALFDIPKHLQKEIDKNAPEYVAQRSKCEDFEKYELRGRPRSSRSWKPLSLTRWVTTRTKNETVRSVGAGRVLCGQPCPVHRVEVRHGYLA